MASKWDLSQVANVLIEAWDMVETFSKYLKNGSIEDDDNKATIRVNQTKLNHRLHLPWEYPDYMAH